MRLRDRLQRVQQEAEKTTHRGAEFAKLAIHNLESGLRHLKGHSENQPVSAHPDPQQEWAPPAVKARTGIVSVNGRDVERMHCTGGRRAN